MNLLNKVPFELNKKPYEGPGRLIFWGLLDLVFIVLTVKQDIWFQDRDNVAESIFFFFLAAFWIWSLWFDLDRWYVPKVFPEPVPAQRSNTLEDEE